SLQPVSFVSALPANCTRTSAISPCSSRAVTGAVFPYTDGATNSEVELLGGSLGLWPTKRMDATSTSPRVTRHVWRASDGGSGGMASARPHDQFAVAQLRSALLILDPFVRLHAIGSPPIIPTA